LHSNLIGEYIDNHTSLQDFVEDTNIFMKLCNTRWLNSSDQVQDLDIGFRPDLCNSCVQSGFIRSRLPSVYL